MTQRQRPDFIYLLIVWSLVGLISACQLDRSFSPGGPMRISTMPVKPPVATVDLLIFSGRPNPRWTLSSQQVKELEEMVKQLPHATTPPPPERLGYSGFVVEVTASPPAPSTLKVFRGVVAVTRAGEVTYQQDAQRTVEQWLLCTASPQLDAELNNLINSEIDNQE